MNGTKTLRIPKQIHGRLKQSAINHPLTSKLNELASMLLTEGLDRIDKENAKRR
jgi:hypothetical protein